MSLSAAISAYADRANADLKDVHNFYELSKEVWRVFQLTFPEGRRFSFTNRVTNTVFDEDAIRKRTQHYTTEFLAAFTFQRFVGIFESFTFNFLRAVLLTYPGRLSDKLVRFSMILAGPDLPTLVAKVVEHEPNQLRYEKPTDWFEYLEESFKLGCPSSTEIERLSEIKASRDVIEHNAGIVKATYLSKSGKEARYKEGDKLEILDDYHRASWELIKKIVHDMTAAGIAKFSKS